MFYFMFKDKSKNVITSGKQYVIIFYKEIDGKNKWDPFQIMNQDKLNQYDRSVPKYGEIPKTLEEWAELKISKYTTISILNRYKFVAIYSDKPQPTDDEYPKD